MDMIAYHGTHADFDQFELSQAGRVTDAGALGTGFYFSTDERVIDTNQRGLKANVSLTNPLTLTLPTFWTDKTQRMAEALDLPRQALSESYATALREEALAKGYDGVILDYTPTGYQHQELVAFHPEQIEIIERRVPQRADFDQWFAASQVTDPNGNPLIVYHGTDARFEAFDRRFLGSVSDTSDAREGFWFSASRARALSAARDAVAANGSERPYVMSVILSVKRPKIIHQALTDLMPCESAEIARQARASGFDGVIFNAGEYGQPDFLAFESKQIRLARDCGIDCSPENEQEFRP